MDLQWMCQLAVLCAACANTLRARRVPPHAGARAGAGVGAHFLSLAFCALFSAAILAAAASFSALRLSAASLRAASRSASSDLLSPPALAFSFIRAFIAAFS